MSNRSNNNNYHRSISSPEGFLFFLPSTYITRSRSLRNHQRNNMTSNNPNITDNQRGGENNSQSVSSGLSLVPRLVDHQTLRDSWNNVVQQTLNAVTQVRNNTSNDAPNPTSLSSWLHSRAHRPSVLSIGANNNNIAATHNDTSNQNASSPVAPTSPANSRDVVLDMQYIDQTSTSDDIPPNSTVVNMNRSSFQSPIQTPSEPTAAGGTTENAAGTSSDQTNIPKTPILETAGGRSNNETRGGNSNPSSPTSPDDTTAEMLRQNPEATAFLLGVFKYLPFVIILLAKAFYDHIYGIFLFVALFATFRFYNVLLKRSVSQADQSIYLPLILGLFHIQITIMVFYFIYQKDELYNVLIFIPPINTQKTDLIHLIWIIIINDFIIKLSTVCVKILVTMLPVVLLPITKRGKWYLFIELTSQFYRSLVPIQLWLLYLMESYVGHQKVVGVFLSAAYIVAKGSNLMNVAKAWWKSLTKLLDNIQLGVSPTKEMLLGVGCICPICHDEFKAPVQLTCCHIFCESCVTKWFDREQTCPLCRAKLVDDPSWRDGSTSYFIQVF